jgi:hypothetical protein
MKIPGSRFTLAVAAKLRRKFRSSSETKDKDLTTEWCRTYRPGGY